MSATAIEELGSTCWVYDHTDIRGRTGVRPPSEMQLVNRAHTSPPKMRQNGGIHDGSEAAAASGGSEAR